MPVLRSISRLIDRFSRWLGGSSAPFLRSPIQIPMALDEVERATAHEEETREEEASTQAP